jgi:DNA-binding protein YbaB
MSKSIKESVKEAKARIKAEASKKSSHTGCCDISYEGDGEIKNLRVEVADNGFIVEANYGNEKIVVKSAKEAGEAIEEFLT